MLAALTAVASTRSRAADPPEKPAKYLNATDEAIDGWQNDRFGMFVCWGPVSLTGKEIGWSRGAPSWGRRPGVRGAKGPTPVDVYDNLYKKWKPDKFDARAWVKLAQDAGQKYMIFLVKHHDGFCLYDTELTDFRSTAAESAWQVDVMKEIADACRESGLKLIIYYSQPDWHHPDYLTDRHGCYIEFLHGQVRELLTNYGRIDGLWFDNLRGVGPETAKLWDAEELFRMARDIQPHLVINNRCGLPGDFDTPEQHVGGFQLGRPWEACVTLGTQWSWKPDDRIKSLKECIDLLVTCAIRGGNLALNTNPMPDGRIEPRQAVRFREIGQWMRIYGETIYGTRGGPFRSAAWGGTTQRGKTVFVHILKWPGESVLLPPIEGRIVGHNVLTGGTATVEQTDEQICITVPADDRHALDTIVALTLDVEAGGLQPGRIVSGSIAYQAKATASNVFQNDSIYRPGHAVDDDPETRWGCDWGTKAAWLAVDLGEAKTFDRAWIREPYDRVQQFELQAKDGDAWQTFHSGTTIGSSCQIKFSPVTAREVRLNLVETTDGPSIWEFQLFPASE